MSRRFFNEYTHTPPYFAPEVHYGADDMFAGNSSLQGQSSHLHCAPIAGNDWTRYLGQQSVPSTVLKDGGGWSGYSSVPPSEQWDSRNTTKEPPTFYSDQFGTDFQDSNRNAHHYADHILQAAHDPHYQPASINGASLQVGDAAAFYHMGFEVPHLAYRAEVPQHNVHDPRIGRQESEYPPHEVLSPHEQSYVGYLAAQLDHVGPSGLIVANTVASVGNNYVDEADASKLDAFQGLPGSAWAYTNNNNNSNNNNSNNNNVQMLSLDQHSGSATAQPNISQGLIEGPIPDAGVPQLLRDFPETEQEPETSTGEDHPAVHTAQLTCLAGCGMAFRSMQAQKRHMGSKHYRAQLWLCPGRGLPCPSGMGKCRCRPEGFSRQDNFLRHLRERGPLSPCYREARRMGWDPSCSPLPLFPPPPYRRRLPSDHPLISNLPRRLRSLLSFQFTYVFQLGLVSEYQKVSICS